MCCLRERFGMALRACMPACVHECAHACAHAFVHAFVHVCGCVLDCVCICVCCLFARLYLCCLPDNARRSLQTGQQSSGHPFAYHDTGHCSQGNSTQASLLTQAACVHATRRKQALWKRSSSAVQESVPLWPPEVSTKLAGGGQVTSQESSETESTSMKRPSEGMDGVLCHRGRVETPPRPTAVPWLLTLVASNKARHGASLRKLGKRPWKEAPDGAFPNSPQRPRRVLRGFGRSRRVPQKVQHWKVALRRTCLQQRRPRSPPNRIAKHKKGTTG